MNSNDRTALLDDQYELDAMIHQRLTKIAQGWQKESLELTVQAAGIDGSKDRTEAARQASLYARSRTLWFCAVELRESADTTFRQAGLRRSMLLDEEHDNDPGVCDICGIGGPLHDHPEEEPTYVVIRFRQDGEDEIILRGVTLDEAQAHCRREDTHGEGWFDGYEDERSYRWGED